MTFDDGFKDHIHAAEILKKKNSIGIFFIPTLPFQNNKILNVHKVHLLTGKVKSKLLLLEDTNYKVNYNYKSKNLKKNLNVTLKKEKIKENKKIVEQSEDDMKFVLQAIIIKIMKTRKELDHNILVNECITNIGNRFKVKISIIKKCIEILIDKDYLNRCDTNSRYTYIS